MDSVTQFLLGASISGAVLAPRIGAKALIIGGVVGTLPDFDGLIRYADPIDSMTYHRGFSHSFFVQTAAAPLIAFVAARLVPQARAHWWMLLLAVWLALITHSMLDSLTTYGTQIFWPLAVRAPAAFPSVFIVDPVYSLLLLAGILTIVFRRKKPDRGLKANGVLLGLSTLYLAIGMTGHMLVKARAADHPAFAETRLHVQPSPLNILFWQVMGLKEEEYILGYTMMPPGCPITHIERFDRQAEAPEGVLVPPSVRRLEWFTDGFYNYIERPDGIAIADLRIGLERALPFTFVFAREEEGRYKPITPRRAGNGASIQGGLDELMENARENWAACGK